MHFPQFSKEKLFSELGRRISSKLNFSLRDKWTVKREINKLKKVEEKNGGKYKTNEANGREALFLRRRKRKWLKWLIVYAERHKEANKKYGKPH